MLTATGTLRPPAAKRCRLPATTPGSDAAHGRGREAERGRLYTSARVPGLAGGRRRAPHAKTAASCGVCLAGGHVAGWRLAGCWVWAVTAEGPLRTEPRGMAALHAEAVSKGLPHATVDSHVWRALPRGRTTLRRQCRTCPAP